jgi:hypothetical protein
MQCRQTPAKKQSHQAGLDHSRQVLKIGALD